IVGIDGQRLFEVGKPFPKLRLGTPPPVESPPEIMGVGLDVVGSLAPLIGAGPESYLESLCDRLRDLVLHREDVAQLAIVGIGPELVAIGDGGELGRQSDPTSRTADTAGQHRVHIESTT